MNGSPMPFRPKKEPMLFAVEVKNNIDGQVPNGCDVLAPLWP
jgi:hypothetical protein